MTDNEAFEQELLALGQEFRQFPSVAAKVMAAIELPEPSDANLIEVVGVDRIREIPRRWTIGVSRGVTALATVAVASVAIMFALTSSNSVAFAQVQERLSQVHMAKLQRQQTVAVTYENGQTQETVSNQSIFVRNDGRVRIELPEGRLSIISEPDFRMLDVDPGQKTARLTYLYTFEGKRDFITSLRTLHKAEKAMPTNPRVTAGKSCPGFRIEEQHATLQVWVDPVSRLPVHAERTFRVLNDVPPSKDGTLRKGKTQITETYLEMSFDAQLANDLFDVTPPVGYALTTVGTPPADRNKLFDQPLVLSPLNGLGPLRFGMPEAEILQLLGNPDKSDVIHPSIPISDDTQQVGDQPRPPGGQPFVLTEFHLLQFNGLGLRLTFEVEAGLTGITCLGQEVSGPSIKSFSGSTNKGLRLGSTEAEVLKSYGEPDKHPSADSMHYSKLGLMFQLNEARIVRLMTAADGVERQLRFEWRVLPEAPPRLKKSLRQL